MTERCSRGLERMNQTMASVMNEVASFPSPKVLQFLARGA